MTQWKIDPAHSEVSFRVKHLVVSTVTGRFDRFNASIETGSDDFSDATISFEADVESINTRNAQRDDHLKSPDFFDAAKYPKIRFVSASVKKLSDHELQVAGELTMRTVTRLVTLDVVYNGTVHGFGGSRVAGFEIHGTINRFDFGLLWNAVTEAGGIVVGNDLRIEIHAEFTESAEAVRAA